MVERPGQGRQTGLATGLKTLIDQMWFRRARTRLRDMHEQVDAASLPVLRASRARARELRRSLDRFLQQAEGRLALPLIGSDIMELPLHSDWGYRPELWRIPIPRPGIAGFGNDTAVGQEARLFHDCARSELTIRQIRNAKDDDLAPFGVLLDVFRFDGSFLSMVIDLPGAAVEGLKRRHLVQLALTVESEQPLEIFARLNIQHGPNTAQLVRELPMNDVHMAVDFDLGFSSISERHVERAWLDLIFDGPGMNQIHLRDLVLSRRPRAEV